MHWTLYRAFHREDLALPLFYYNSREAPLYSFFSSTAYILLKQPTKVGTYSLYMLIYVVFQFTQKKSSELSIRLSRGKPICLMFEMPIFFLSGSKFHLHGMLSITWTSLQRTVYFIVFSSFINLNVIGISQIIW